MRTVKPRALTGKLPGVPAAISNRCSTARAQRSRFSGLDVSLLYLTLFG